MSVEFFKKNLFTLKINCGFLILLFGVWAYLIRDFVLPFNLPFFLKNGLMAALLVLFSLIYLKTQFAFQITRLDGVVLTAYIACFVILNYRFLLESIACDELYHAGLASIHIELIKVWAEKFHLKDAALLLNLPVNELSIYSSILLIGVFWIMILLLKKLFFHAGTKSIIGLWSILFLVGYLFSHFSQRIEIHPPLRLLPLFISQAFLGLTDFAFRLPGIISVSLLGWMTFRIVAKKNPCSFIFPFLIGFSIYMIPTVFHVSATDGPSIWAFTAGVICLFSLHQFLETSNEQYLILSGIVVGVGSLFRQPSIFLWPIILVFVLTQFQFRKKMFTCIKIFLPGLFIIPYLVTVKVLGYYGALSSLNPVTSIIDSILGGVGPLSILKSTTPLWCLFLLLGSLYVIFTTHNKLKYFYLSIFPGYCAYYSIQSYLWGVGRYQAEFIAPLIVLTIVLLAAQSCTKTFQINLVTLLLILSIYSFHQNLNAQQDIHFQDWPRKKISTESYFPYKEALGFLQRQETDGKFIIIGGAPIYGDIILWLRGFTLNECKNFRTRFDAFHKFLNDSPSLEQFYLFLENNDIHYFLIQYGDKRERQHYSDNLKILLEMIAEHSKKKAFPFSIQHSFYGNVSGAIDIFYKSKFRYQDQS